MPTGGGGGGGGGKSIVNVLRGTGSGVDYSTASLAYVVVDATNLSIALTVPATQQIVIWAMGKFQNSTLNDFTDVAIAKDATPVSSNEGGGTTANSTTPGSILHSEVGDGVSHTWALYFKAVVGGTAMLGNSSTSFRPVMVVAQFPI